MEVLRRVLLPGTPGATPRGLRGEGPRANGLRGEFSMGFRGEKLAEFSSSSNGRDESTGCCFIMPGNTGERPLPPTPLGVAIELIVTAGGRSCSSRIYGL